MAPFDNPYSSNLTNKLSPLLEGQVPDFIQADHPVFVKFLKSYYEYLEAGELRVSVVIDNLLLELETESFVLDVDDNKIVLEDETDETTGKFVVGETITGATSKATATILVDDLGNSTKPRLFITGQQQFKTGETITGGTSGSTGTVVRYRANPVQNIQQLLEYSNVDNTIHDFLDQLRDSFMNAIPTELATGVNKRNLIKNIRELYRAKGTSEGHKIFMRMLLDENIEVTYPNKYMMRTSGGKWTNQTILRCSPGVNSIASEMLGVVVTGQSSGATVVIANAISTAEGGEAIIIFEINPASLVGTFTDGETIQGTSTVQDVTMTFTVRGMVTNYAVTDGGKLYSVGDDLDLDTQTTIGNGEALAEVASVKTGSVSRVIVDNAGTLYREGDVLTFTTTESGTDTKAATGFVSVIDGSLEIDGTDSSSTNAGDNLVLEAGSTSAIINSNLLLDGTDSSSTNAGDRLTLNRTNVSGHNAGHFFINETDQITLDSYGTDSDTFALEDGTVSTGEITRVFLKDGGGGYSLLPSVTVTSTAGTSTLLTADTNDIGAVDSVNVTNQGFKYTEAPEGQFRANFILKDVSGTFAVTNTLASSGHTGVVKDWNSTTKVLKTTFEDVQRVTMETGASEGIELEQNSGDNDHLSAFIINTGVLSEGSTLLEDATAGAGRKLSLDATAEVGIDQLVLDGTDGSSTNAGERILVEGVQRPGFERGFITEAMGDANVSQAANAAAITKQAIHNITLEDSPISGEDSVIISEDTAPILLETSPQVTTSGFNNHVPLAIIDNRNRNQFAIVENEGESLLIDGFENLETYDFLTLDGTDSVGANSGERLINESSFENNNQIILDGSAATEVTINGAVSKTNKLIVDGVSGTIAIGMVVTVKSGATSIADGASNTAISTNDTLRIVFVASQTEFRVSESVTVADGIILSLQTDVSDVLLNDIETAAGSIAINGTNSTSNHAGDNIVNEDPPDFSAEGTTITDSGGASGTIVSVDIAKGTSSIGTKAETTPSYGVDADSLIGEDLNRIQDSVYYQQFSYEIEAASSQADYLTELKKAVHPAGFNVFGKVNIASLVSAAIPNAGASLGGGFTSTFSPILASTFTILFSEEISRAVGVMEYGVNNFDDEILLEDDETNVGGELLLNGTDSSSTNAGGKFISETLTFVFPFSSTGEVNYITTTPYVSLLSESETYSDGTSSLIILDGTNSSSSNAGDTIVIGPGTVKSAPVQTNFESIEITHGTDSGDVGRLVLDSTDGSSNVNDRIISESAVALSFNMLLEPEDTIDGGNFWPGFSGTDSNILLDGTDSSSTNAGDKFEFEIGNNNSSFFTISLDTVRNTDNVLNEDGGNQYLETAGKGDVSNKEISVISRVQTKINLPNKNTSSLPTGLITMAESPFGAAASKIDLEIGTVGGSGSGNLTLVGFEQINLKGGVDRVTSSNEDLVFEDATDDNIGTGFSFSDFGSYTHHTMVLNGTDGSSTDADDNITLESGTLDLHGNYSGGSILGELTFNYPYMVIEDIIRPARFLADKDGGSLVNLVSELSEIGSFRLEDETTVSSTYGDYLLMENATGVGRNNKLSLEKQYLIPEDEVRTSTSYGFDLKGIIPEENYTNSDIEPYTYTSDIVSRPIDTLVLEDLNKEATNIQLESGTEGGIFGNLVYDATGTDADDNIINENSTIGIDGYNLGIQYGGANFLLNRTALTGDFTNVGEEIILETATFYETINNTDKLSVPLTFENAFDSTLKKFDTTLITWDSTL
jgi:hypothetical protein